MKLLYLKFVTKNLFILMARYFVQFERISNFFQIYAVLTMLSR